MRFKNRYLLCEIRSAARHDLETAAAKHRVGGANLKTDVSAAAAAGSTSFAQQTKSRKGSGGLSAKLAEVIAEEREEREEQERQKQHSQHSSDEPNQQQQTQQQPTKHQSIEKSEADAKRAREIEAMAPLTGQALLAALKNSIERHFGVAGLAAVVSALQVKYFNRITGLLVVRCARDHYRTVWGALTLLEAVKCYPSRAKLRPGERPSRVCVAARVLHVSGTIKLCQEAAAAHDAKVLLEEEAEDVDRDSLSD